MNGANTPREDSVLHGKRKAEGSMLGFEAAPNLIAPSIPSGEGGVRSQQLEKSKTQAELAAEKRRQRKAPIVAWKEPTSLHTEPPSDFVRIIAVRHAQAMHNVAKGGSVVGAVTHRDPLLTEQGEQMARELTKTVFAEGVRYDLVVVSPLRRALQTCALAFADRPDCKDVTVVQPLCAEHRFLGQRDALGTRTALLRQDFPDFCFPPVTLALAEGKNPQEDATVTNGHTGIGEAAQTKGSEAEGEKTQAAPRKGSLPERNVLSVAQMSKLFPPQLSDAWWEISLGSTVKSLGAKAPVMNSVGGAIKSGSQWLGGVLSGGLDMALGKDQADKFKSKMDGVGQTMADQLNGLGWETEDEFKVRARAFVFWLANALPPHVSRVAVISHRGLLLKAFGGGKLKYGNCEWRVFDIKRGQADPVQSASSPSIPILSTSSPSVPILSAKTPKFADGTSQSMLRGDSELQLTTQSDRGQPVQNVDTGPWACNLCTFENAAPDLTCHMCGNRREPKRSASDLFNFDDAFS